MNIIFGKEQAEVLKDKYTVLELDTFQVGPDGLRITAYCTIENIPLDEIADIVKNTDLHNDLLQFYQTREWKKSLQLIDQLIGLWGGELDSFYFELQSRINNLLDQDPGTNWNSVIIKDVSVS
jgi:hypothetical protein